MSTIRVVWGTGTGPTEPAAFDAALADAGVHECNLVSVSSVIPPDASLEAVGTAPDLCRPGEVMRAVVSRRTAAPAADAPAVAGLGWARSAAGAGVVYEGAGTDRAEVRQRIRTGLDHGVGLRDWSIADSDVVVRACEPADDAYATAVVLACFGAGHPLG